MQLQGAQRQRRYADVRAVLQVERHADDILLGRVHRGTPHERIPEGEVPDTLLPAGVDDCPDLHRTDPHVCRQQSRTRNLQGNGVVTGFRVIAVRAGYHETIRAEVSEDPLVQQAFSAQHALSAAKRVGDHGQGSRFDQKLTDFQAAHVHCGQHGRSSHAVNHHRQRFCGGDPEPICDVSRDSRMARTGIENETKGSFSVDGHRRPDAADAVTQRRGHVYGLGRLDDHL